MCNFIVGLLRINRNLLPVTGPLAQWLEQRTHNPLVRG
ncbi:uncharacterized protein METZ01_LOCUS443237, partial [marine metagenome]